MLRHAFLLLAAAPLWSADTGRLEGRIIHSINRAGIAGVTVELRASGSDEPAYSAVTDPAGEFQLSGIKPGEYTASFEKNGFFRPKSDGPEDQPVRIAAGPEPVRLRVELCPYTRVSGRVLDSEGNPKPRIVVELLSAAARRRMRSFTTGDDGAFAFDELEPGAYVLRADPSRTGQARHANPEQPIQDPRQLWAPAYFPNTTDYQQAGVILARGGALGGYDIRLPQADLFRVRGTVLDEAGRPAAGVQVGLKSADGEEIIQGAPPSMRMQTNSNGAFEFGGVGRGLWHAVAGLAFQAGSPRGFASVSILDREPREIAIRLAAPFRLRVVEEGLDARAPLGPVQGRIRLVPVEGGIEQY
ncbi:MAG: carboxypeptidase-like regulatory domain-containing protein, partial [Acidobacteriia bacterium]|nr:carboxypeptidase-like regulatory domain-containing protein [Terriglobia bacterium]